METVRNDRVKLYIYILLTAITTGFLLFILNRYFGIANYPQQITNNYDLSDPTTILGLKNALVKDLQPGTLTIDSSGRLITTASKGEKGAPGEDGEPGQQGERGLQGLSGLNGTSDGWKKQNGVVSLADASDLVGLGTDNPHFKLQVNGDVGPGTDDQNSLGSEAARWQSVNVGTGGVKLVNSYIDASNNETGGLSYAEYIVPFPGASTVLSFDNEANFSQQELKNGATTYTANGKDVTVNVPISANVQAGCRMQLNNSWYTITDVVDSSHVSVESAPVSSGSANHVYCTSFTGNAYQLNGHSLIGPGDLNTFNSVYPDTTAAYDTWSKPVVYASSIQKYVAGGYVWDSPTGVYHAVIYSSGDLQVWDKQVLDTNSVDTQIKSMIYEPNSGKIVAAGYDNTTGNESFVVWESPDAITWTKHVVHENGSYWDGPQLLVYDTTAHRYVFSAHYYDGSQYTINTWESTDLLTWTVHNVQSDSQYLNLTSMIYAPVTGKFVLGGYYNGSGYRRACVWESSDLLTWTRHDLENNTSGSTRATSLAYNSQTGTYVGMGWDSTSDSIVWESTDLVTWVKHNFSPVGRAWPATILYNAQADKYIIGGEFNDPTTGWRGSLWYSSDLATWTQVFLTPEGTDARMQGFYYDEENGRFIGAGITWGNPSDKATIWYTDSGVINTYPANVPFVVTTNDASQLNTSNWLSINSMSVTQILRRQRVSYAFSFDNRQTWKILQTGQNGWRSIVRNSNGTWQYNTNVAYDQETWVNASMNTAENALSEAMVLSINLLTTGNLSSFSNGDFSKPNGFVARSSKIDIAVGLETTHTTNTPIVSNILINYEDSFSDNAVTISSKAQGSGEAKPFQVQVGAYDKALFINSNGNVGIGTNAPTGVLDVKGLFVVKEDGKVGIGTITPGYTLDINGDIHTSTDMFVDNDLSVGGKASFVGVVNENTSLLVGSSVGIGTTNPQYKLDVVGQVNARDGLCIQGECWNALPYIPYSYDSNSGVTSFVGGIHINNTDANLSANGWLTGIPNYQGGELKLSGSGNFSPKVDYATSDYPYDVAIGDMNNDGWKDIVMPNPSTNTVFIYVNNQNGTLATPVQYPAGNYPFAVATADLNKDSLMDFVITNFTDNTISVYLNNGAGGFFPQVTYPTGSYPRSIAVGDVNNDGNPDVLVGAALDYTVSVYVNNGEGILSNRTTYAVSDVSGLAVGDFNGDNYPDFVTGGFYSQSITTYVNDKLGTFVNRQDYSAGSFVNDVAISDINNDGYNDIVLSKNSTGVFSIFLNNRNQSFENRWDSPNSLMASGMNVVDVTGDGRNEVVVANKIPGGVSVWKNRGNMSFDSPQIYSTGPGSINVAVGDLNNDGALDIVSINQDNDTLSVLFNNKIPLLYAQANTGYVGIGTVTPGAALDVKGAFHISGATSGYVGFSAPENAGSTTYTLPSADGVAGQVLTTNGSGILAWNNPKMIPDFLTSTIKEGITNFTGGIGVGSYNAQFTAAGNLAGIGSYQGGEMALTSSNGTYTSTPAYKAEGNFVVADFNNDSYLDLANVNPTQNTMYVRFGNKNGTYSTENSMSTGGTNPQGIAFGDLNSDGYNDIAVTNGNSSNITVFTNNQNGTFTATTYSSGTGPSGVVIGDVNGDGKKDVVVTNANPGMIAVYINNGNGTLAPKVSYGPDYYGPRSIVLGDLNGDNKNDIAANTGGMGEIMVFLNSGTGTFPTNIGYNVGSQPNGIVMSDFNSDNVPDLAAANTNSANISVLINNGNGTFATRVNYAAEGYPQTVAAGDLNGDGKTDLISMNYFTDNSVSVFINNGNGTFANRVPYALGKNSYYGVIADINKDNKNDVLVQASGFIATFPGNGNGTIDTGINVSLTGKIKFTYVSDVNGDSKPDIIASPESGTSFAVLINNGNYSFAAPVYYNGIDTTTLGIGDVNGDGKVDVVTAMSVMLNNGNGTFGTGIPGINVGSYNIALGDLTGDGKADIVAGNNFSNTVAVYISKGDGTFSTATNYSSDSAIATVRLADFDGDAKLDVATTNFSSNTVLVYRNTGNGVLGAPARYTAGTTPIGLTIDDFNNDGKVDLAVTNGNAISFSIFTNKGDGTFNTKVDYTSDEWVNYISSGDTTGDGKPDISVVNNLAGIVSSYTNNGDGTFTRQNSYFVSNAWKSAYGDLNNDGKLDLVVGGLYVSILKNQTNSMFYAQASSGNVGIGTTTPGYKLDVQGGQINSSGGYCLAGNCVSDWSQLIPFQRSSVINGVTTFTTGLKTGKNGVLLTNEGNIKTVGSYQGGEMLLMRNTGFGTKTDYPAATSPYGLAAGDVNGDGNNDVVVVNNAAGTISVLKGNGDGTLAAKVDYTVGANYYQVSLGDINGDGSFDIVTAATTGVVSVLYNDGKGLFGAKVDYTAASNAFTPVTGDVNGDGKIDVVVSTFISNTVLVLINNGNGFNAPITYDIGGHDFAPTLGDLNGDGKLDIVVTNSTTNVVAVLLNNGNGTFASKVDYAVASQPVYARLGDFNSDGKLDIATVNQGSGAISVLLNNGNGTFAAKNDYTIGGGSPQSLDVGDLNGDGKIDIVELNLGASTVSVLINSGTGAFPTHVEYGTGPTPRNVVLTDLNNDGKLDITTSNWASANVSVLLNQTAPMFYAQASTGYIGIGTVTPGVNLDVAGAIRSAGNITSNNATVATGTLANAPSSGTCAGQTNSSTQAIFQSSATVTSSHIFYNATRTKHSRVTSVSICTDINNNAYRVLTLTDSIIGSTAGDSFSVYSPASDIGNASSGFFNNIYAVNFNGLTSTLTGGFDLAEQYQTNDKTIAAGDVVSIAVSDPTKISVSSMVEKTVNESDSRVLGVVSTNPGLTFGNEKEGTWVKVALAGRVPVHVSSVNGTISAGDFLSSSVIPGAAVKAVKPGMVIGRALEDLVCAEGQDFCEGTIMMFVNLTWYTPGQEMATQTNTVTLKDMLNSEGALEIPGNMTVNGVTSFKLDVDVAQKLTAKSLVVTDAAEFNDVVVNGKFMLKSKDIAGFAVVRSGDSQVTVTYAKPYDVVPVLSVSAKKSSVDFVITNETVNGFTIVLSKGATTEDVTFSWIALQVKDPVLFDSSVR